MLAEFRWRRRAPGNGVRALHFQLLPSAQGRRRRDVAARAVAMSAFLAGLCLSAAPANAACAPDPASSGQTVTCSGNTPAGFQAGGGVDNLTVNVLPGATVSDGGGGVDHRRQRLQHGHQQRHAHRRAKQHRHLRRREQHDRQRRLRRHYRRRRRRRESSSPATAP